MKTKYYFNGNYLVKGRKFFGKIIGIVVSTNNTNYHIGESVKLSSETFREIDENTIKQLKTWGYLSNFDL